MKLLAGIMNAIQCQLDAREDVRHLRTSHLKDGSARPLHVIGALFVTDHLQCEVCLNACTYVRSPSFEQRPAAFDPLSAAKIPGDLPFKLMVRRLAKIMNQYHILGRDRSVRLEFEYPMP